MTNYYINIHRNQAGPYDLLPEAHGFLRLRLAVGSIFLTVIGTISARPVLPLVPGRSYRWLYRSLPVR